MKDLLSLWAQNNLFVVNGELIEEEPKVLYTKYMGDSVLVSPHFCDC